MDGSQPIALSVFGWRLAATFFFVLVNAFLMNPNAMHTPHRPGRASGADSNERQAGAGG